QFLNNAGSVMLERVRSAVEGHGSVKANTAFISEFVAGNKRTVMENMEILSLRLIDDKEEKHVNVLYIQDPHDDNDDGDDRIGHFVLIKHLSHLVSSLKRRIRNISATAPRSPTNEKLQLHAVDCGKMNNCAIKLPSEDEKWLSFRNHCRKERVSFIVYADLETGLAILLTGDTVSESDYAHVVNIWKRFFVRTLGEYSDLYLKTDVLFLADVFENFRKNRVASYNLDPAHYFTLPGFTWDAMLKHTLVKFELLTAHRHRYDHRARYMRRSQLMFQQIQTNNKYMRSYDPSKPSSYLMFVQINEESDKMMENVRDRVDVKLITTWDGRYNAEAMIAKLNFHSCSVFAENLIAVELRKLEVTFDNPIYVGICTFDISKVCRCLNEEIEIMLQWRKQSCIRSKLHQVYTVSEKKIVLSPYDQGWVI
ncbi:hypothetical protein ALC62_05737, partial [Cyphomyrmex costatus]